MIERCGNLKSDNQYRDCRGFYRGNIKKVKMMTFALFKQLNKNLENDIRDRCKEILVSKNDKFDGKGFLECSQKVSKEHINKIPEYMQFLDSVNSLLKNHKKEFN